MATEPKVTIEETELHGADGQALQQFATVYIGQQEYRIYAPPKATGSPLEWLAHLHVHRSNGIDETDIQGTDRTYLIEIVQQKLIQLTGTVKSMTHSIGTDKRKVFVVYGRNSKARIALFDFSARD